MRTAATPLTAHPRLRAVESFLQLQEQLTATEDKLEFARPFYNTTTRRFYNTSARDYDTALQTFPRNLLAGAFGFTAVDFFETDEADRGVPQVPRRGPRRRWLRRRDPVAQRYPPHHGALRVD